MLLATINARSCRSRCPTSSGASASTRSPGRFSPEDFRRATEEVLLQQAATGSGVILGRGAVVVLREDPRALRVRLDGPAASRVSQAMRLDPGVHRDRAERALRQFDRTHAAYLQLCYGVDIRDSTLYHLALDSTCIELDACVEIIARAGARLEPGRARGQRTALRDNPQSVCGPAGLSGAWRGVRCLS